MDTTPNPAACKPEPVACRHCEGAVYYAPVGSLEGTEYLAWVRCFNELCWAAHGDLGIRFLASDSNYYYTEHWHASAGLDEGRDEGAVVAVIYLCANDVTYVVHSLTWLADPTPEWITIDIKQADVDPDWRPPAEG